MNMAGKRYLDAWSLGNSTQSANNIAVKLPDSIAPSLIIRRLTTYHL